MKKLGFAAVLLLLMGIGAWQWAALETSSSNTLAPSLPLSWPVGWQKSGRVELQSRSSLQLGAPQQDGNALVDQKVSTHLKALVTETILENEDSSVLSLVTLKDVQLTLDINHPDRDAIQHEMIQGLEQSAYVVRNARGNVTDVRVPSDTAASAREFYVQLMQALQYSLPEGPAQSNWTSIEVDENGRYEADYTLESQANTLVNLRRLRRHYHKLSLQISSSVGKNRVYGDPSGSIAIQYDSQRRTVTSMQGEDILDFFDGDSRRIGFNRRILNWRLTGLTQLSADALQALRSAHQERFQTTPDRESARLSFQEEQERFMYAQRLGNTTLSQIHNLYQQLDQEPAGKDKDDQLIEAWLKLRAYVYLHPEALKQHVKELAALPIHSSYVQSFISALVNISSPAAQEALADLTEMKRTDAEALQTLVPKLGFVQKPEATVIDLLHELKQDEGIRGMVDLAYGTAASQLAKAEGGDAETRLAKLEVDILNEAASARSPQELVHQLDVLGNMASPRALDFIEKNLGHPDPKVRATAAYALRDLETDEASQLLMKVLQHDQDGAVRTAAAQALANFRPTRPILDLARQQLLQDPFSEVRAALLKVVEKSRYLDPALVREILENTVGSDTDEQVRQTASMFLAQL